MKFETVVGKFHCIRFHKKVEQKDIADQDEPGIGEGVVPLLIGPVRVLDGGHEVAFARLGQGSGSFGRLSWVTVSSMRKKTRAGS
jgi:hypothetical protein